MRPLVRRRYHFPGEAIVANPRVLCLILSDDLTGSRKRRDRKEIRESDAASGPLSSSVHHLITRLIPRLATRCSLRLFRVLV